MMVQRKASVAPKTVTEFSEGKLSKPRSKRVPKGGGGSSRIDAQRIDSRVWKIALELAGKQAELLDGAQSKPPTLSRRRELMEILGGNEVIIHNNPNWKRR